MTIWKWKGSSIWQFKKNNANKSQYTGKHEQLESLDKAWKQIASIDYRPASTAEETNVSNAHQESLSNKQK